MSEVAGNQPKLVCFYDRDWSEHKDNQITPETKSLDRLFQQLESNPDELHEVVFINRKSGEPYTYNMWCTEDVGKESKGNLKTFHATFITDGKNKTAPNIIHRSITGIMNGDVEYRASEHTQYLQMMHVQLKYRFNRLKDVVEATIPTAIEEKALTKEEEESLLAAADEDSTGQRPSCEKVSQENKVKLDAKRAELESIKRSFETVCSALGNIDKSEGVEAYNGVILTFNELVSRIDRLNEPLDWDSEQYLSEAKGATNLRHTFETQIVEFLDTQIGLRKNGEMPLKRNKRLEKLNVLRENAAPKYKTPAVWTSVTRK